MPLGQSPRTDGLSWRGRSVMGSSQYGCNEAEKDSVLASCQRSDRALQFVLGRTAYATARRWGVVIIVVILAAIAASAAGLSPR